jgi:hypothetical protein
MQSIEWKLHGKMAKFSLYWCGLCRARVLKKFVKQYLFMLVLEKEG